MMELRALKRKNTITSLNSKAIIPLKSESSLKNERQKPSFPMIQHPFQTHHAFQYIRGTFPSQAEFKKFVNLLYKGLLYGLKNLKGPSQSYVKKKKVKLPEPKDSKNKKFLFMDLDQTLIHSEFAGNPKYYDTQVKVQTDSVELHFNVRPYCLEFLQKMAKYYNVYVFTAGTQQYAQIIIKHLNKKKQNILGCLHRKNCMQTNNGYHIKDLRIVQNRDLKDIVIVDNLVHSFGLQIENGIPILEYTDQKNDQQLKGLEELLIQLSQTVDVRDCLRQKLALRKVLNFSQNLYLKIDSNTSISA